MCNPYIYISACQCAVWNNRKRFKESSNKCCSGSSCCCFCCRGNAGEQVVRSPLCTDLCISRLVLTSVFIHHQQLSKASFFFFFLVRDTAVVASQNGQKKPLLFLMLLFHNIDYFLPIQMVDYVEITSTHSNLTPTGSPVLPPFSPLPPQWSHCDAPCEFKCFKRLQVLELAAGPAAALAASRSENKKRKR